MKDETFEQAGREHIRAQHGNRRERLAHGKLQAMTCKLSAQDLADLQTWSQEYRMSQGHLIASMIATHRRQRARKRAA